MLSGVDLNRNYEIKFSSMEGGASSDPCNLEYRGKSAFSEPETRAIRDTVLRSRTLVSALNFHAYANLWIYPYSYNSDQHARILRQENRRLWQTYKDFAAMASFGKGTYVGDAISTIHYSATGEASDWMLNKRNVFAFSPELGHPSEGSQTFYPNRWSQLSSIR